MLVEIDSKAFHKFFPVNPHPFISEQFIELNKGKVEKVLWLINDCDSPTIGLICGIKEGVIKSPFSAPFGGFHFRNEIVYISEIDNFVSSLKQYIISQGLKGFELILPPDIYHLTFNTKTVSSLIRTGFQPMIPEITNWVNLQQFNGTFTKSNSREYYRQAVRNGLSFDLASNDEDKSNIYDLICKNRARFDRPIYMTFKDLMDTNNLWPVDFFKVLAKDGSMVASAIFYRSHPQICYATFWGDNEKGRLLRAMDFLSYNLWKFYKNLGFSYIDLGISTEEGIPNEGLLRYKESHDCFSSIRFSFYWSHLNQI